MKPTKPQTEKKPMTDEDLKQNINLYKVEIKCPYCGLKGAYDTFALDMLRNYLNNVVTLNQCDKCKGVWTE